MRLKEVDVGRPWGFSQTAMSEFLMPLETFLEFSGHRDVVEYEKYL